MEIIQSLDPQSSSSFTRNNSRRWFSIPCSKTLRKLSSFTMNLARLCSFLRFLPRLCFQVKRKRIHQTTDQRPQRAWMRVGRVSFRSRLRRFETAWLQRCRWSTWFKTEWSSRKDSSKQSVQWSIHTKCLTLRESRTSMKKQWILTMPRQWKKWLSLTSFWGQWMMERKWTDIWTSMQNSFKMKLEKTSSRLTKLAESVSNQSWRKESSLAFLTNVTMPSVLSASESGAQLTFETWRRRFEEPALSARSNPTWWSRPTTLWGQELSKMTSSWTSKSPWAQFLVATLITDTENAHSSTVASTSTDWRTGSSSLTKWRLNISMMKEK